MQNSLTSLVQQILLKNEKNVQLYIKREDLIHPFISGNKYRKLKYNIKKAKSINKAKILTFGGAYSNHIAATAWAGKESGLATIGVIRGEELEKRINENPTLSFAQSCGMQFLFITREEYRNKSNLEFIEILKSKFGDFYLIPEGGTNELAVKGCEEILNDDDSIFNFICTCVGTGGTISGLINTSEKHQKILGFPALKGDFLQEDIRKFAKQDNWRLILQYHFGGYGKINTELITFINSFKNKYDIPLDPIYTGKMMFGICDLIAKNYFPENSKVLIIHTGGLQGISGMNLRLKRKNLPLIEE
ncbi:1-aminocyclopropane-1-carboxylate deaminase/D-cysteine desulfhydrase [Winogradskyella sp. PE311]|uniref:1-aminocyclopropane-1-carboxylate deaminase/D-cysteine desulfhydrase n=1 Tax=Winogradskyella sp. PE311 TaxID=3366943 RepID=UPI003981841B